jgi:hypothetical protein
MPKEHILSASRIKTYESCTWKYWCGYVLKLPKTKNDGNVRGSACHLILEVLLNKRHKQYIKKIIKASTIKAIPSIERLVRKSLRNEGEEFYTEENVEMCDDMIVVGLTIDDFLGGKGSTIDKPEEEFFLDTVEDPDKPSYKMMGYIDKPVQFKRGKKLKIIDYKTNAKLFAPDEIDYNPQAFAYLLAAKKVWPKLTDTSIEFHFLRYPEEAIIEIKYTDDQLEGFEYYLEHLYNLFNNFTEKDASSKFAAHEGFPKDEEGFTKRLNCGFANYPGDRKKKDGSLKWYCQYKFAHDYYAVVDENGDVLYSSMKKEDLNPKEGEKIEKRHYSGCPAWPDLNEAIGQNSEQGKEDDNPEEFPF